MVSVGLGEDEVLDGLRPDEMLDILSILDLPLEGAEDDEFIEDWDSCFGPIPSDMLMGAPKINKPNAYTRPSLSLHGHVPVVDKTSEQGSSLFQTKSPISVLESSGPSKSPHVISNIDVPVRSRSKRAKASSETSGESPWLHLMPSPPPKSGKKTPVTYDATWERNNSGLTRMCSHCKTTRTPQWRLGPMGCKTLCNACGVRFRSGRLLPEYRPFTSPTFVPTMHSNSHRKIVEMRYKAKTQQHEVMAEELVNISSLQPQFVPEQEEMQCTSEAELQLQSITPTEVPEMPSTMEIRLHDVRVVELEVEEIHSYTPAAQSPLSSPKSESGMKNKQEEMENPIHVINSPSNSLKSENEMKQNEMQIPIHVVKSPSNSLESDNEMKMKQDEIQIPILTAKSPSNSRKSKRQRNTSTAQVDPLYEANYLENHENCSFTKKCSHCAATETSVWRRGPMGPMTLCNACGLRFRDGRLFPEYRPFKSPTFVPTLHSNFHWEVAKMQNKVKIQTHKSPIPKARSTLKSQKSKNGMNKRQQEISTTPCDSYTSNKIRKISTDPVYHNAKDCSQTSTTFPESQPATSQTFVLPNSKINNEVSVSSEVNANMNSHLEFVPMSSFMFDYVMK